MKEVLPPPSSAIVQNETKRIRELFERNVVPSYTRFDLVLERGEGSYVWDVDGKRYLDLAGGIAVCSLGHSHPEITKALQGDNPKQINFLKPDDGNRVNGNGELVDPWGTPYFFHQLSATDMEIRSAGPDRKMWSDDDLVTR